MAEEGQRARFLEALRGLGGNAGNGRLRETLGWDPGAYAEIYGALLRDGMIVAGRGRGGSVRLVGADGDATAGAERRQTPMASGTGRVRGNGNAAKATNGANLGFEAQLFRAADKLRGNMEPSDYKHVALGLIFLKHISDSFEAKRAELVAEWGEEVAEDEDEYRAENIFWVPKEARWAHLQANAKQPGIGGERNISGQARRGAVHRRPQARPHGRPDAASMW